MVSSTNARGGGAFTLVEMMVSVAVFALLLSLLATMTTSVSRTVRHASSTISAFASARAANDLLTQKLSLATLNTYYGYDVPAMPTAYLRLSDLQFLIQQNVQSAGCGQEIYFAAPQSFSTAPTAVGLQNLMNACGYYVQYGSNADFAPTESGSIKWRYRLMQGFQRAENLELFNGATDKPNSDDWTKAAARDRPWLKTICNDPTPVTKAAVTPIADNVIALILLPLDPAGKVLTTDYTYDSIKNASVLPQQVTVNQLPPTVQVTLITISEASAATMDTNSAAEPAIIHNALINRFSTVSKFDQDLKEVSEALRDKHIGFRIFNSSVPLRESKWSGTQSAF